MPGSMTSRTTRSDARPRGHLEALMALVGALHGEALAVQELGQQGAELGVIVHQQDVHG